MKFLTVLLALLLPLAAGADASSEIRTEIGLMMDVHAFLNGTPTCRMEFARGRGFDGYQSYDGFRIHESCFDSRTIVERKKELLELEATILKMKASAARCRTRRGMPDLVWNSFKKVTKGRPLLTCNADEGCGGTGKAAACAYEDDNRVNFIRRATRFNPFIIFHEFLHLGGIGNQPDSHNEHTFEIDWKDDVVFWEKHCFRVDKLLDVVRRTIKVNRIHGKSTDPCLATRALGYREDDEKPYYTGKEISGTCAVYRRYFNLEKQVVLDMKRNARTSILKCTKDNPDCDDSKKLNSLLKGAVKLPLPEKINSICYHAYPLKGCLEKLETKINARLSKTSGVSPDLKRRVGNFMKSAVRDAEVYDMMEKSTEKVARESEMSRLTFGDGRDYAPGGLFSSFTDIERKCRFNYSNVCRYYREKGKRDLMSIYRFW